eukprot:403358925
MDVKVQLNKQISVDKIKFIKSSDDSDAVKQGASQNIYKPQMKLNLKQNKWQNGGQQKVNLLEGGQSDQTSQVEFNLESKNNDNISEEKIDFNKTVQLVHKQSDKIVSSKSMRNLKKVDINYGNTNYLSRGDSESVQQQQKDNQNLKNITNQGITYQFVDDNSPETPAVIQNVLVLEEPVKSTKEQRRTLKHYEKTKSQQQVIQEEDSQEEASMTNITLNNRQSLHKDINQVMRESKIKIKKNSSRNNIYDQVTESNIPLLKTKKTHSQVDKSVQEIAQKDQISQQLIIHNDDRKVQLPTEIASIQQLQQHIAAPTNQQQKGITPSKNRIKVKYLTATNNTKVNTPEKVEQFILEESKEILQEDLNRKSKFKVGRGFDGQAISNKLRRSLVRKKLPENQLEQKPQDQINSTQQTDNLQSNRLIDNSAKGQALTLEDLNSVEKEKSQVKIIEKLSQDNDVMLNMGRTKFKLSRNNNQARLQSVNSSQTQSVDIKQEQKQQVNQSIKYQPPLPSTSTLLSINTGQEELNNTNEQVSNKNAAGNQSFRSRKYGVSPREGINNNLSQLSRATTPRDNQLPQSKQDFNRSSQSLNPSHDDLADQKQNNASQATIVRRSLQAAKHSIEQELMQQSNKLQTSQSLQQLTNQSASNNDGQEQYIIVPINRSKKIEQDSYLKHLSKVVGELLKEQLSLKSKLNQQEQIISNLTQQSNSQQHFFQPNHRYDEGVDNMRNQVMSGGPQVNNRNSSIKLKLKTNKAMLYNQTNSNHHFLPQSQSTQNIQNLRTIQSLSNQILDQNPKNCNTFGGNDLKNQGGFQRYLDQTQKIKLQQFNDNQFSNLEHSSIQQQLLNLQQMQQPLSQSKSEYNLKQPIKQKYNEQSESQFGMKNRKDQNINNDRDKSQGSQTIKNTYQNIVVNLNSNSYGNSSININPMSTQNQNGESNLQNVQNIYQISQINSGQPQNSMNSNQENGKVKNTQEQNQRQEYYTKKDIKLVKLQKRDKSLKQTKNLKIEVNQAIEIQAESSQKQIMTQLPISDLKIPQSQGSQSQESAYNFSFSGRSNTLEQDSAKKPTSEFTYSPDSQVKYEAIQPEKLDKKHIIPTIPRIQTMESNYSSSSQFSSNNQSIQTSQAQILNHSSNNNLILNTNHQSLISALQLHNRQQQQHSHGMINTKKFPKDFFSPQNSRIFTQESNNSQMTRFPSSQNLKGSQTNVNNLQKSQSDSLRQTFGNMNFTEAHLRVSQEYDSNKKGDHRRLTSNFNSNDL